MTFLILFSSVSYSIEKHICEGEIHTSLFNDAESLCRVETASCHTESLESTCCSANQEESNCCLNTSEFIKGISLDQQAQTVQKVRLFPVIFLLSDFFTLSIKSFQTTFIKFNHVKQPPKLLDLGILFQVFRI